MLAIACGGQQAEEQAKTEVETVAEPPVDLTPGMKAGKVVYDQYCTTCHQQNGSGVPNLNPPLTKTDYVTGDKERLIRIVLRGSNEGLAVNGMVYSNAMPAHVFLNDEDVAHVLSYIRNSFGNRADTLAPEEVAQVRDTLK